MSSVYHVKAVPDDRVPTNRAQQVMMIAATIPFAVIAPPIAGLILAGMVALRWDLRFDVRWWILVASGIFLPWGYIIIALVFLSFGGTRPGENHRLTLTR